MSFASYFILIISFFIYFYAIYEISRLLFARLRSFPESQIGIEKKEKIVSIYFTIVAILAALKEIKEENSLNLLAYFIFFVVTVYYYIVLRRKKDKDRFLAFFSGIMASSAFSCILVSLVVPFLSQVGVLCWLLLTCIVSWSLIWPLEIEDVEDEYILY